MNDLNNNLPEYPGEDWNKTPYEDQTMIQDELLHAMFKEYPELSPFSSERHLEASWVAKKTENYITTTQGWSFNPPAEVLDLLEVGKPIVVETRNFSIVTGWFIDGAWVTRKTDEDLEREHAEMVAGFARERAKMLEENRERWTAAEAALPQWLRDRIESFRESGGKTFELDGWGYELAICAAAAYIDRHGLLDEDELLGDEGFKALDAEHGFSGNQVDFACLLVRAHQADPEYSLAGTISALSPITGDPHYEGKRA